MARTLVIEPVNGSPRVEYRLRPGSVVQRRANGEPWTKLTRNHLLALPADGLVWEWLRSNKEHRPSPPGVTQTAEQRKAAGRVRVEVWLSQPAAMVLEALAETSTKRDVIERLLLGAKRNG